MILLVKIWIGNQENIHKKLLMDTISKLEVEPANVPVDIAPISEVQIPKSTAI